MSPLRAPNCAVPSNLTGLCHRFGCKETKNTRDDGTKKVSESSLSFTDGADVEDPLVVKVAAVVDAKGATKANAKERHRERDENKETSL